MQIKFLIALIGPRSVLLNDWCNIVCFLGLGLEGQKYQGVNGLVNALARGSTHFKVLESVAHAPQDDHFFIRMRPVFGIQEL